VHEQASLGDDLLFTHGKRSQEVTDMDNKCFSKCCKDSGLVDKKVRDCGRQR
jgi:hypothetical protein